jgi:malonyl CoA-acyl carrier protein transacylase
MTDDQHTPEAFDPAKFVKGLPSAQLEIMSELHDEAALALRLLTRAGETFQAPTGRDMLKVFQAAGPELIERFAVRLDGLPQR